MLQLVVERSLDRHPLAEAVRAAAGAGVDWLQLRDRTLEGRAWLAWAESLAKAAREASPAIRILVNRRIDVALAIGADGVQLGFDAVDAATARSLLGDDALIGVSCHHPDEVAHAAAAGASHAQLAPIHAPLSKPATRPALGTFALAEAARHGLPVIAQGGIDARHCADVLAAGARGIAVTGAILMADDPAAATAALRAALDA